MSHPACRQRCLAAMTRAQIEALPGRAAAIVVVPTGSIEQHGPHLPVGVDAMLGQAWLAAALAHLPARIPVYAGPAVTYGKSNEHDGFPGTVAISARTLHRLLQAIARQVRDLGFGTIAVLNTHGGNSAVVVAALRDIQARLGLHACMIAPAWKPPVDEREARFGIHAGRIETAWMLAVAPHLVAMDKAVCEFPPGLGDGGEFRPFGAPFTEGWKTKDLSRSGVIGDAAAATAEDGRAWFEAGARSLAARIVELAERVAGARSEPRG